jgi:hypothetical protein
LLRKLDERHQAVPLDAHDRSTRMGVPLSFIELADLVEMSLGY